MPATTITTRAAARRVALAEQPVKAGDADVVQSRSTVLPINSAVTRRLLGDGDVGRAGGGDNDVILCRA